MQKTASLLATLFATPLLLAQVPVIEQFGSGCGGYGGQEATIDIFPPMRPGSWSTIQLDHLTPFAQAVLMIGDSRTQWGSVVLPASLAPVNMPGCSLLVSPLIQMPFFTTSPTVAAGFPVPEDPVLAASDLYFQAFFAEPGLNAPGIGLSKALRNRVAPLPTPTSPVTSITQFGITFQFAQPVEAGQFVNGDWFVIGPVTLVDMQPACTTVGTRVIHGAMINPNPSTYMQGYDRGLYGAGNENRYSDTLNVAKNLAPGNPLVLAPNQSLVKIISNMNTAFIPQIDTCAVLTCLAVRPPLGSFRPPYAGNDHSVAYDVEMIDWSALLSVTASSGMPSMSAQVAKFERPWLDHAPGWPARFMHPVQNMPDYGRDFTTLFNESALMCNVNLPLQQKQLLVTRLVQVGIDFWGNVKNGCSWEGTGGHDSGRKLPILFAGALLHDVEMLAVGANYPSVRNLNGTYTAHFGEDCQTFVVQQTSATQVNWGYGGYTSTDVGTPEFGFAHVHAPNADNSNWLGDSYRRCCTANAWIGGVLCARMMGLKQAWSHDALFDYMDRYTQIETSGWTKSWSPWVASMWDAHRASF